ncbi:DUF1499 domain-containing protein [Salipaludibacillus neizhouensis]|uniref:DUF1499 domain-containing protein n=1 Tax=Salipaludibacillus neizhouensis TaxID=885475 RepID=A0A3A9K757_9BACI|nr:DUF1499 domain-containing protein [Salipaludibacillus neizhouensis]RKL66690.1 DUF1499 domain-containing protein [Salipaludibacillus neizhouensis]
MGFKDTINKIFSSGTETKENHFDETLKTHYYKTTKDKVIKELEVMFGAKQGYEVASISEEHGEVIVRIKKGKKAFMVVTVIMVRPFRTAIDFSVSTDTIIFTDFGYSGKLIRELYKELDSRLPFVGTSLGDKLTKE